MALNTSKTTLEKMNKIKSTKCRYGIRRRRKFTSQNRKLIYKALRGGLTISNTVKLIGLDRSTYYRWMKLGKDKKYPMHKIFRKRILKIQAQLEKDKLGIILKVAKGGYTTKEQKVKLSYASGKSVEEKTLTQTPCWQAAAWFLERRFPETYRMNRQKIVEVALDEKAILVKQALDILMD